MPKMETNIWHSIIKAVGCQNLYCIGENAQWHFFVFWFQIPPPSNLPFAPSMSIKVSTTWAVMSMQSIHSTLEIPNFGSKFETKACYRIKQCFCSRFFIIHIVLSEKQKWKESQDTDQSGENSLPITHHKRKITGNELKFMTLMFWFQNFISVRKRMIFRGMRQKKTKNDNWKKEEKIVKNLSRHLK